MRVFVRWIFRSVIVSGILGLALTVVFFILASRDARVMTPAEFAVGIPMVLLWFYFWLALIVGIILHLVNRDRSDRG